MGKNKENNVIIVPDKKDRHIIELLIIAVTAIVCVTICSESSPIYPFNNWDDANCFFTVGKSVVNGRVMYRDVFEQKGPLLYFIYSVAYLISNTTFLGGWIMEILSGFAFLSVSYKMMRLFRDKSIIAAIPVFGTLIYSSLAFAKGGSAEEFCLPMIAACFYFGLRAIKEKKRISYPEWFLIGILSGGILWIKFSMLGFFVGFGVIFAILYFKNKWIKEFFPSLLLLILGIVGISLPILNYFRMNNALSDLYEVYFYDNLFLYSVNNTGHRYISVVVNLNEGLFSFILNNIPAVIMLVFGYKLTKKTDRTMFIYFLTVLLSTFLLIYMGGRKYQYYSLILDALTPIGMILPFDYYSGKFRNLKLRHPDSMTLRKRAAIPLYGVLCAAVMFAFSQNTYLLKYRADDTPMYKFARIMSQTEDPTLIYFRSLDGGFYTAANITPHCRAFCGLNIPYDALKIIQEEYILHGWTDYVITHNRELTGNLAKKYEFVAVESFETRATKYEKFYLYKKKGLN